MRISEILFESFEKILEDDYFGSKIIWSEESYISRPDIFNRHSNQYCSLENEHVTLTWEQEDRFGFSVSCFEENSGYIPDIKLQINYRKKQIIIG